MPKTAPFWAPHPGFWPSRAQNHPFLDTTPWFLTLPCPKSTLFVHHTQVARPFRRQKGRFRRRLGRRMAFRRYFARFWRRLEVRRPIGRQKTRFWRREGTGGPFAEELEVHSGGGGNNKKGLAHCQPFFNRSAGAHQLKAVLGRNSEFLAAVTATRCENAAAVCSSHTLTETVLVDSLAT